jgi:DNA-binding transcriptional LysR family regulator
MTLEQLRIFVAVAERQHLTRAADALHLSPSAVSAALRTLEQRYGARLFDRVGRGIELTETGRHLLPEARQALAAVAAAELALTERGGALKGRLAVAASQTVSAYWLPRPMLRFHATHPGVALDLAIGNTETVTRAVRDGTADLGFIEGEIDEPALAARLVAADRLVIVTAPDHPWAAGPAPTPSELAAGRWILRERGSGTRSAFEASLRRDGLDPGALDIAMTLPSNEAILTALGAGPYAGVASERVAASALAASRLCRIDYPLRPRPFRMLWHKERYRTRAARAFEALLPQEGEAEA